MKKLTAILICLNVLWSSSALATSRVYSSKKAKTQQHFSFVPAYKPMPIVQKLQAPLSGQVSKQVVGATTPTPPTIMSIATSTTSQSFNTTEAPPIKDNLKSRTLGFFRNNTETPINQTNSWVDNLLANDAVQLSNIVAQSIQKQVSEKTKPIYLENVPSDQHANAFTLSLTYALKNLGYGLCESQDSGKGVTVRYRISRLDNSYLIRVKVNVTETAWLYEKNTDGSLVAASAGSSIKQGKD